MSDLTSATTKEQANNLTYEQLKLFVKNLCLNGQKQNGSNFMSFFRDVSLLALKAKNMPDSFTTLFTAFNTTDRGVVLVIFQFHLLEEQGKELFSVTTSFVEDPTSYRCPHAVLDLVTDTSPSAVKYKELVANSFSRETENNVLVAHAEKRKSIKFSEEEEQIFFEGEVMNW